MINTFIFAQAFAYMIFDDRYCDQSQRIKVGEQVLKLIMDFCRGAYWKEEYLESLNSLLHSKCLLAPLKYNSKHSIFHNIFKRIYKFCNFFLIFFQYYQKIENDVMI